MFSEQRPSVTDLPDTSIAWGSVADSMVALATSRIPGSTAVIQAIKALYGVGDAQTALLLRIGRDVELIRTGPFRSAGEHVATAMRKSIAGTDYERHLVEAENLLIQALGQHASTEESSVINFNLGIVAAIRGDRAEAEHRLRQAYDDSVEVANELSDRASDTGIIGQDRVRAPIFRIPLQAFLIYMWPFSIPQKIRNVHKARVARKALAAYLPFLESVVLSHNAIAPVDILPEPHLLRSRSDFRVEWAYPANLHSERPARSTDLA